MSLIEKMAQIRERQIKRWFDDSDFPVNSVIGPFKPFETPYPDYASEVLKMIRYARDPDCSGTRFRYTSDSLWWSQVELAMGFNYSKRIINATVSISYQENDEDFDPNPILQTDIYNIVWEKRKVKIFKRARYAKKFDSPVKPIEMSEEERLISKQLDEKYHWCNLAEFNTLFEVLSYLYHNSEQRNDNDL